MLSQPDFTLEKKLLKRNYQLIVGIDEAGRGALAGPLTIAGLAFKTKFILKPETLIAWGIKDSKELSPIKRQHLIKKFIPFVSFAKIVNISNKTIDRIGIKKAEEKGIRILAQEILKKHPQKRIFLLIDYYQVKNIKGIGLKHQQGVKRGDKLSLSIAAASILAKQNRDGLMIKLSRRFHHYHWQRNKGYGTKSHFRSINENGITKYHRLSFLKFLNH